MAWPTKVDAEAFISSLPMAPDLGLYDIAGDLAAAIREFETTTGRPGFQDGTSKTLKFDAPDGRDRTLNLYIPDFSAIASVRSGTTALTLDTDYYLHREVEYDDSTPYTKIEFVYPPCPEKRGVTVVGTRGYGTLPEDVRQAILKKTLSFVIIALASPQGQEKRRKNGEREVEWDTASPHDQASRLSEEFDAVTARYLRVR